ncbi:substrate-binding domain-containing protein [Oceanomicrobium pacificus]|uniref:Substrate-binding domain-containing protein n=1 Tax=Oceanomicrobium pacificus TaxID=2692916 RepID=A0A6B0TRD5_9RHOB|nr:substrate-binding domain-containing protein [Oceanomicrobium pacificus]MXU65259.1 substrate-binding domain-containing protein [Oceanomicrobium pacificus]
MTNLKTLADHLGLSQATVSRALNGYETVSARTRERVAAAAQELNYRPNTAARRLATGRADAVGIILTANRNMLIDPHFADFLAGMTRRLAEAEIDVVMTSAPQDAQASVFRRYAETGKVDGFVVSAPKQHDPRVEALLDLSFPFVVHGQCASDRPYSFYDIDNYGAFRQATDLLLQLGHRRIAFLNGTPDAMFAIDRLRAYRDALGAAGLPDDPRLLVQVPMTEETGYAEMQAMLASDAPPTGIICSSMILAMGAQRAIRDVGLAIGRDISVISHDDGLSSLKTENFSVPLTVTRAPIRRAGLEIADMLQRLVAEPDQVLRHLEPVDLIVRGSTAPPPVK